MRWALFLVIAFCATAQTNSPAPRPLVTTNSIVMFSLTALWDAVPGAEAYNLRWTTNRLVYPITNYIYGITTNACVFFVKTTNRVYVQAQATAPDRLPSGWSDEASVLPGTQNARYVTILVESTTNLVTIPKWSPKWFITLTNPPGQAEFYRLNIK